VEHVPQTAMVVEFWLEKKQDGSNIWSKLHADLVDRCTMDSSLRTSIFKSVLCPTVPTALTNVPVVDETPSGTPTEKR